MPPIGEELKRERCLRGITLKEIASSTKISLRLLEALEEDRLDILPGKFFNKAIIKSYANYIGLDEDYVLNMYYETSLYQEKAKKTEKKRRKTPSGIPKRIIKLINFIILIIILLASLSIIYFLLQKKETPRPLEKAEPSVLLQEEEPLSSLEPSALLEEDKSLSPPVIEPLVDETEKKEMIIEITFLEETWIQVYADDKIQVNGIKNPGEKVRIKALKNLLLNLGNAGGVSYTLNTKEGKPLGSRGAVVKDVRITLENYTQFLAEEKEPEDDSLDAKQDTIKKEHSPNDAKLMSMRATAGSVAIR